MRNLLRVLAGVAFLLLAAFAWLTWRFRPKGTGEDPAVVRAEIDSLRIERDRESALLRAAIDTSPMLANAPQGDVVIGLPSAMVDTLARSVLAGWFEEVTLRLGNIHVHKAGDVKVKMGFLGKRRLGTYDLDLTIDEVNGRLRPGRPLLDFGGNKIGIVLPVHASGGGWATIKFAWDSKGMANPVCGDLAATRRISGSVLPETYQVRGRIALNALEGALIADPDFPELSVRLRIVPSDSSIRVLEALLASKGGVCGMGVEKADVRGRILGLVDRGFNVKIPQKFFRPVRLPIAVNTQVPIGGRTLELGVTASGLHISEQMVWLGAAVAVAPGAAPPIAAATPR